MVAKSCLVISLFIAMLGGCASNNNVPKSLLITSVDSVATEGGVDEFCSNFSLNEQGVLEFFESAKRITSKEMHDKYEYLPCFVKGRCELNSTPCEWEIRAGGTGSIDTKSEHYLYGCENCL